MRLWSIHPSYLDNIGLIACWREGLLAKKVLEGNTKGYVNHPQLLRFIKYEDPLFAIECYLSFIIDESIRRGYRFDKSKISYHREEHLLSLNRGQLDYEWMHFLKKIELRNPELFKKLEKQLPKENPIFYIIDGGIEEWEKYN